MKNKIFAVGFLVQFLVQAPAFAGDSKESIRMKVLNSYNAPSGEGASGDFNQSPDMLPPYDEAAEGPSQVRDGFVISSFGQVSGQVLENDLERAEPGAHQAPRRQGPRACFNLISQCGQEMADGAWDAMDRCREGLESLAQNEGLKRAGKAILCFAAAGGMGYGCYLASVKANGYWSDVSNAEAPAQAISGQFRSLCRTSASWQKLCLQADPIACQNTDYFNTGGNPYRVLSWNVGDCGNIESVQDNKYENVQVCQTSCSTNTKGQITCSTSCYWVTEFLGGTDLTYLVPQCPNYGEYQNFLNSTTFRNCETIVAAEKPLAQGYTAAAVFGALGTASATAAGVTACLGVW